MYAGCQHAGLYSNGKEAYDGAYGRWRKMSYLLDNLPLLYFLASFLLGLAIGRRAVLLAVGGIVVLAAALAVIADFTDLGPTGDFTVSGAIILFAVTFSFFGAIGATLGYGLHQLLFHPRMPWASKTRPFLGGRGT